MLKGGKPKSYPLLHLVVQTEKRHAAILVLDIEVPTEENKVTVLSSYKVEFQTVFLFFFTLIRSDFVLLGRGCPTLHKDLLADCRR